MKTGLGSLMRFSLGAKNSSFASKEDSPSGRSGEVSTVKNFHAAQESGFDYTHKVASRIGCQLVAMMKLCRIDCEACVWVPDHQIGVAARRNRSLLLIEADE